MALHLAFSWAKSLFEKSPINPERDCYNLDEDCQLCHNPIKPAICIVVCKCQKYSHYQCLINKFSSLTLDRHKEARCEVCHEIIKIQYETTTVFKPKLELCLLIEALIALALLVQCGYLLWTGVLQAQNTVEKVSNEQLLKIVVGLMGVLISAGWLIILLRKIFWKAEMRIKTIFPASMKMSFSDFENHLQSQNNNVQNIREDSQETNFQKIQMAI